MIAVSKTKPVSMIEELLSLHVTEFGENKVQETCGMKFLPSDLHWHLIGHLQRNKVKYIVDKACLIHSVDSLRLAEEIRLLEKKKQLQQKFLIKSNVVEKKKTNLVYLY